MLKARKANRVIRIPDEKKDAYIALGYKITDMNDKVVAEPHNAEKEAETLKAQVTDLETKLKGLLSTQRTPTRRLRLWKRKTQS